MDTPSTFVRDLSRRLLTIEAANGSAADLHSHEAIRVCEKLRISLTRLAGADGFAALLRRALILARTEADPLRSVTVKTDCTLDGFEQLASADKTEAGAELTTHLLDLLVTFIGQPLTLRLVREVWPDVPQDYRL
jgi:hypothetical protein